MLNLQTGPIPQTRRKNNLNFHKLGQFSFQRADQRDITLCSIYAIWICCDVNYGFQPGQTHTYQYSHRSRIEAQIFGLKKKRDCTISVAKTKMLIMAVMLLVFLCGGSFYFLNIFNIQVTRENVFTKPLTRPKLSVVSPFSVNL